MIVMGVMVGMIRISRGYLRRCHCIPGAGGVLEVGGGGRRFVVVNDVSR